MWSSIPRQFLPRTWSNVQAICGPYVTLFPSITPPEPAQVSLEWGKRMIPKKKGKLKSPEFLTFPHTSHTF